MDSAVEPIGRMTPYGVEHISIIIATVVIAVALVWLGRRIRGTVYEDRFLRIGGWIMLGVTIAWSIWGMLPGHWNIDQSLPFQDRKSTRLNSSHVAISYAVFCLKKIMYKTQ